MRGFPASNAWGFTSLNLFLFFPFVCCVFCFCVVCSLARATKERNKRDYELSTESVRIPTKTIQLSFPCVRLSPKTIQLSFPCVRLPPNNYTIFQPFHVCDFPQKPISLPFHVCAFPKTLYNFLTFPCVRLTSGHCAKHSSDRSTQTSSLESRTVTFPF